MYPRVVSLSEGIKDRNWVRKHTSAIDIWIPSDYGYVIPRSLRQFKPTCNLSVYTRITGGGAVILSPHTMILDIVSPVTKKEQILNSIALSITKTTGKPAKVYPSWPDIVVEDRKIAGTSFYYLKDRVFISISIIIHPEAIDLIDKCLPMPDKAPDYRAGRPHREFLTYVPEQLTNLLLNYIHLSLNT